ncbi:ParA family protein [Cupriavidus sp. UME77]|uniref:ParA family protein n=1 Tax=Cupriavidus sp. UME77 TaxID=1862321 RepID=UPI001600C983|nr:AAA family ATPase [Cupriavidus sp. UME77]MBB1636079.1 cobyrinic acid a,c-diamide synthase [Cupriavidus sp. UME77]
MIIGIFNNKGGVGKTTYLYHVAHEVASRGKKVLLVDADPQCNLTAYCLRDSAVEEAWAPGVGTSLFINIQPLHESMGDVLDGAPVQFNPKYPNLFLVPGDPNLSDFEDTLGDTWNRARGGSISDLRKQTGIFRYIKTAAKKVGAEITFLDLGPNLGPLNRTALTSCDYFLVPVSPDLFSIRGTQNLGRKLVGWRAEWNVIRNAGTNSGIEMPHGAPKFVGYVRQQHNTRNNEDGMTQGWRIFGSRVADAIGANIVGPLGPLGQVISWQDGGFDLGSIPNLHSLVPYSQEARKPIFDCTGADGLRGAHLAKATESRDLFDHMTRAILGLEEWHLAQSLRS